MIFSSLLTTSFLHILPEFSYVKYREKVFIRCMGTVSVVNYEGQQVNFSLSVCTGAFIVRLC